MVGHEDIFTVTNPSLEILFIDIGAIDCSIRHMIIENVQRRNCDLSCPPPGCELYFLFVRGHEDTMFFFLVGWLVVFHFFFCQAAAANQSNFTTFGLAGLLTITITSPSRHTHSHPWRLYSPAATTPTRRYCDLTMTVTPANCFASALQWDLFFTFSEVARINHFFVQYIE